jgi:COP9 signalosome complex subunit 3
MLLDVRSNTLAVLYILSARVSASFSNTQPPPWPVVQDFCRRFHPEHARYAPDRVTKLAKGIHRLASHYGSINLAIYPLRDLLSRYPYDPSFLTTIHPIFMLACVSTRNFLAALPVLSYPITNFDTSISPELHYSDNLSYHYTGGIALAALKRWAEAEEYFEICVTSPGTYPAALQLEALKKLRLVQLISGGKPAQLPKYTHPLLLRLFKNTPYQLFINAYPNNADQMREIYEKEKHTFNHDKNMGLILQAAARAPRWVLKKLTSTYVTLHLSDIGRAIKIDSDDEVRALLLSMIEANDISAQISASGTVTFSDTTPQFTKEQVDNAVREVQQQTALLAYLDQQLGRSKDFLSKAVKAGDSAWAPSNEEEIFANLSGQQHLWEENVYS